MQSLMTILRDPRNIKVWHDLALTVSMALAAMPCGAKSCVGMANFGLANQADLAQVVALPCGAPSHDSLDGPGTGREPQHRRRRADAA